MTVPTDKELSEHWRHEPAPLLPLLHAFHDRDGYLSDEAINHVSQALDMLERRSFTKTSSGTVAASS